MAKFHLTTYLFNGNFPPVISHEIKDDNENLLIVFDLHNCLSHLRSALDGYDEVLDIHLLETILYLGKYHRKYFENGRVFPTYGLRKHISEFSANHTTVEASGAYGIPLDFWPRLVTYARKLQKRAMAGGIWKHYQDIEIPFSRALYELTKNGVTLDSTALQKIRQMAEKARQEILYALDINKVSGPEINDLNDWVREYRFNVFFPAGRDKISIKDLSLLEDQHQVFKIFQRLNKLKRIISLLDNIGEQRKIRPSYKTMGAVTGRCTSTNPNIMGIPKIFRPVVIPSRPDFGIVECDYSQMEVGVAAALSNDGNLIADFNTADVYEKTGELLFGGSSGGSRSKAKVIFLGIQYGLSRKTIAKLLETGVKEISNILDRLYARYSGLSRYLNELEKSGQETGYVESISGLKRYRLYPRRTPNYWERNWFKNFPIQSSAAAIFKGAIIKIYKKLKYEQFNLLVPLYDSVIFECPLDCLIQTTRVVEHCMIDSMREYFPKLKPKVSINDSHPSCWNSEGKGKSIEEFLNNPLFDIDIREKSCNNVDWSNYL